MPRWRHPCGRGRLHEWRLCRLCGWGDRVGVEMSRSWDLSVTVLLIVYFHVWLWSLGNFVRYLGPVVLPFPVLLAVVHRLFGRPRPRCRNCNGVVRLEREVRWGR